MTGYQFHPQNGGTKVPFGIGRHGLGTLVCLGLAICLVTPLAAQEEPATSPEKDVAVTLVDICDQAFQTIQLNAYRPVTRQQFALVAARVIHERAGNPVEWKLAAEVEQLSDPGAINGWLTEQLQQAGDQVNDWNPDELITGIVRQMEPRAMVISARQAKVNSQLAENRYVGIGIRVAYENGYAVIAEPLHGGTARAAGAKSGDLILEVDGLPMKDLDLGEIVEHLRGEIGSSVSVLVRNRDDEETRRLDMVREVVPIPTVHGVQQNDDGSWEFLAEDQSTENAYMSVSFPGGSTARELTDAANKVRLAGASGVVISLVGAQNADLHHAHLIADALVGKGHFATVVDGAGQRKKLETREETAFDGLRMAVLVPADTTGPILAILNRLAKRPETVLIGTDVRGDLACYSTFDFPDGKGSIDRLVWAQIDRDSLGLPPIKLSSHTPNIMTLLMNRPIPIVIPVDIQASGPEQQQAAARNWLNKK